MNSHTKSVAGVTPLTRDLTNQLQGARYFSKLDFKSAYWQIPLSKAAREKTAFVTSSGLFQFLVLPFGVKNASALFQTGVRVHFGHECDGFLIIFMDDQLTYSTTADDHLRHLRAVFDRTRQGGFQFKIEKLDFAQPEVVFLGFIANGDGLRPDPAKTAVVRDWPVLESRQEVRRWAGFINRYSNFIPHHSHVLRPIFDLLDTTRPFVWSADTQNAFQLANAMVAEGIQLYHPDDSLDYWVTCDAQPGGAAGVLWQRGPQGEERPIMFVAKSLDERLRKKFALFATECEMFGLVFVLKAVRQYVLGLGKFYVQTDHQALRWLVSLKDPNPKLTRWLLLLQEYNFLLDYIPGEQIPHVDAVSRIWLRARTRRVKGQDADILSQLPKDLGGWSSQQLFELILAKQAPSSAEVAPSSLSSDSSVVVAACGSESGSLVQCSLVPMVSAEVLLLCSIALSAGDRLSHGDTSLPVVDPSGSSVGNRPCSSGGRSLMSSGGSSLSVGVGGVSSAVSVVGTTSLSVSNDGDRSVPLAATTRARAESSSSSASSAVGVSALLYITS